ncbi:hypothetical protein [Methylopila sp. M107]|uniref:hypothetical protein n=1 Tax=Methylopila sp. M107 TaxID=1101190 RepID=UPI0003769ABD|nr:hypothetical protein [Methylopila sp. M107]
MARAHPTIAIGLPRFMPREPDGFAEFAISRGAGATAPRPVRVSRVLAAALKTIDGEEATLGLVRCLSAGTREWLLQKVAALFRPRQDWFEGDCTVCSARYDVALDLAELPAKPCGAGFPTVAVETSLGRRLFDAPNGFDEETLARSHVAGDPRRRLAGLCGLSDDAQAEAARFDLADLDRIDAALDEATPQPSERSATRCPSCGHATEAAIEPLSFAFPSEISLLREVHRIAAHYHWSEDAILSLPTRRRRQYLSIIGSERRRLQTARPR